MHRKSTGLDLKVASVDGETHTPVDLFADESGAGFGHWFYNVLFRCISGFLQFPIFRGQKAKTFLKTSTENSCTNKHAIIE